MASPPLVPDIVISTVLTNISDVPKAEMTPRDDPVEMGPHAGTSVGEYFFYRAICRQI
jgi:hypothetical protein